MAQDALGNEVSRGDSATLAGIDDFVEGFLGYETRATNVLAAADADPESVAANVYAGFLWMFLEAETAKASASVYLKRAEAAAALANPREALMLRQLERWIADDIPAVQAIGETIVAAHPRDLASVKLHQYFSFNRGDAAAMLRIAQAAEAANADNPHLHGMLAFAHEQMHNLDGAEIAARRALELKEKEPWAQHALAHVMLGQGRVREGVAFLDEAQKTWVDLNSFMYTHNWWHKALFHISLGDNAAVFDAYDNHVWGIAPDYSQDQVGAVSLLARMEIAGLDVGERWQQLAQYLRPRAHDTVQPFLTLQYLYGLGRAEYAEADQLMQAVEDKAQSSDAFDRLVWREVALPAARGVLAHARGNYADAARWLTHRQSAHDRDRRQPRAARPVRAAPARCTSQTGELGHRQPNARNAPHLGSGRRAAQPRARRSPQPSGRRMKPGPRNLITDVEGLRVGNAEDHHIKTGTTVLVADRPFRASVDVMGGSPGARETELLAPDKLVEEIDAIVLSGGSAFGLDAGSGVSDGLRAMGRGFRVADVTVPIVPGAILFDLINGGDKGWGDNPYRALGARALASAAADFEIGTAGAGTGALTATLKGGLGSASMVLRSGHTVGALVGANGTGTVTMGHRANFWAAPFEMDGEFGGLGTWPDPVPFLESSYTKRDYVNEISNTTIAIVATDADLSKAQLKRLAVAAQDGIARAVSPSHALVDGDIVFAVSTGARPVDDAIFDVMHLGHAAGICLARAIARAVYLAKPAPNDPVPTWREKWGR